MPHEKRRGQREHCSATVKYSVWNEGGQWARVMTAQCFDVSTRGMSIETHEPLEPGAMLKLSKPNDNRLSVSATVRWCEQLKNGLYRSGLSLL